MVRLTERDTKGIVNPAAGLERFALARHPPSPALRWAVENYWVVRWDLRDESPHDQQVVPHPAVHLVFEKGHAAIESISRNEFVRRIEGRGQVLGVKFQPAGFRPFLGRSVSGIEGVRIPASEVFGKTVDEVARASVRRARRARPQMGYQPVPVARRGRPTWCGTSPPPSGAHRSATPS